MLGEVVLYEFSVIDELHRSCKIIALNNVATVADELVELSFFFNALLRYLRARLFRHFDYALQKHFIAVGARTFFKENLVELNLVHFKLL